MKTIYTFDEMSFGTSNNENRTVTTVLFRRPNSLTVPSWYAFARDLKAHFDAVVEPVIWYENGQIYGRVSDEQIAVLLEQALRDVCRRSGLVEPETPIKMILHCPACGLQHIDEPDPEPPMLYAMGYCASRSKPEWTNPPHRSHLCAGCGHIWRPADVATEGVKSIETRGANDSPNARPSAIFPEFRNLLSVASYSDMSAIVTFVACRPAGQFVKDLRVRLLNRKL